MSPKNPYGKKHSIWVAVQESPNKTNIRQQHMTVTSPLSLVRSYTFLLNFSFHSSLRAAEASQLHNRFFGDEVPKHDYLPLKKEE